MRNRWDIFIENIQADLKLFCLAWLLLLVFRIVFIFSMKEYLASDTNFYDILVALYYGARISLKTAGIILAISFFFVTFPSILVRKNILNRLRLSISGIYLFLLSVLLIAKYPYYREFHTGFNQMIFNTLEDDKSAIFYTLVDQYQFWWRFTGAIILGLLLLWLVAKVLLMKNLKFPNLGDKKKNTVCKVAFCLSLLLFAVFIRFGGSLTYAHSLHWENCSLAKDAFLNEVILDDVQAVYRAYSIKKRIENGLASGVHKDKIKEYLDEKSNGQISSNQVDDYLIHYAAGNRIKKPNHIFIIIGESYAQWPLLTKYENLHIADGVKAIREKENADYINNFLPNGAFTPMAVNAIISGLSDVNIYPNHQTESYKSTYKTALAIQLKKLGYKTSFWYAGFSSWERIKDFALAQGFDEFHSASDFAYDRGNVWGCDDEYLFRAVQEYAEQETIPTVHVILTVSNHAPYSVDLKKAGFPEEKLVDALPSEVKADKDLIKRLGHFWYMDKLIGRFTENMYNKYPRDSLFIITGDHADRTNIDSSPTLFERYTIPFVIYGDGIHKGIFKQNTAGGHVNIGATLIELIAPKGFSYYTLGESLTGESKVGFNHNVWITTNAIGEIDSNHQVAINDNDGLKLEAERDNALSTIEKMRTISWWRTMKGNEIK